MEPRKLLYILAGINGSGKSTAAKKITEDMAPGSFKIVSADHYMVNEAGAWQFDPTKLGTCHSKCQEDFHKAISQQVQTIIVDNTSLVHEHRWIYAEHALAAGYDVTLLVFDTDIETALKRNIHGVPRHTLENQKRKLDLAPGIYTMTFDPMSRVA